MRIGTLLAAALTTAPISAFACGGLFCNNTTPIVQQAENIVFAVDGDTTHMHVRISYAGPPQDFGGLLPVPRGVTTEVSTERLFQALGNFTPQFYMDTEERLVECMEPQYPEYGEGDFAGAAGADAGVSGGDNGVTVLSREPVGPYDRAILEAASVEDLRAWLNENSFQIPESVDARLRPYVDAGAVFVAIKLLADQSAGDMVPLHLSFPGNSPTVPIVPTAVAAAPDLGIVVQVLGADRAIPVNYRHVQINEAAVDWPSGGGNYFAVVAQASDEAGGHAFTTDYAGPHSLTAQALPQVGADALDALRGVHTVGDLGGVTCNLDISDPDMARILRSVLSPPDFSGNGPFTDVGCAGTVSNPADEAVDGAALAARVEAEINAPRLSAGVQLDHLPYVTRLFTTMSADEMDEDPSFGFNADLPAVDNVHHAKRIIYQCDANGYYDYSNYRVQTAGGLIIDVHDNVAPNAIQRADGETTSNGAEPGAAVIEQYLTAGPGNPVTDNTPEIAGRNNGRVTAAGSDSGCGCNTSGGAANGAAGVVFLLFGFAATRRRRQG